MVIRSDFLSESGTNSNCLSCHTPKGSGEMNRNISIVFYKGSKFMDQHCRTSVYSTKIILFHPQPMCQHHLPKKIRRRPEYMDQEEIRQVWVEGQDWVIKRQNNQYSHRPDGKNGDWKSGLPPGAFKPDIDTLFDED
jgi:hypothetical protein